VLITSIFIIYRKYKQTKIKLDYEVNDIRNLASIPKSTEIITEMKQVASKEKYTSLTDTA
jgi:hypothetical protein